MEAVTAGVAGAGVGTGSKTIADLLPLAVEKYGDAPAQRHKVGRRLGGRLLRGARPRRPRDLARARRPRHRSPATRSRSSRTPVPSGPTPASGSSPPAAALVTIYQTNSPEECQYVLAHSDSRAVFVEDGEQLAKVRQVRDRLPRAPARDRDGAGRRRPRRRASSAWSPARARRRPRRVRVAAALRGRDAGRRLPLHLHVRHHRAAEGLPALARQLPRDHRRGRSRTACSRTATAPTSSSRSRTPSRS